MNSNFYDPAFWSRFQFAFTIIYHYLFPQFTMGLAWFLVYWKWRALRTSDEKYNWAVRFWAKIFGLNFAVGVVTGIPMEFQFGTNWSEFSKYAGGVIGQTLAMEGMFAFFLESAFIGALIWGEKRLGPRYHFLAALGVALGSWLSAIFILATNAFMQHPVGYQIDANGTLGIANLGGYLLNPWALIQFAIGPLWTWHEVWLISFGGTLLAVFPRLLASAFAGYYLALFLILWGLILRGVSIELGGHVNDRLWQGFWDFVFVLSNFLLAILFGAAAGNVARGVPLDAQGNFSMAFFTDFRTRGYVGLLDWYTVSIATFAMVILAAHGATYLTLKTEGPVHDRCAIWAKYLWVAVAPLFLAISIGTFVVRPGLPGQAIHNPFCYLGLFAVAASTVTLISGLLTGRERRTFIGSNLMLVGLLITGAAAIFPVMLFSTLAPENSLTAYNVAAGKNSFLFACIWWPVGFALATFYYVFISQRYAGKVSASREGQGFY
jgi:cytochrome bd ubiquinol oxidase subunit II